MRHNNKSYLKWTLFAGSLCPISIPLLTFDLSIERIIVPLIVIYLITLFLINDEARSKFLINSYVALSFLIIFIIVTFSLYFIDFENFGLPVRLLYNLISGYIIYILYTLIYKSDFESPEFFIFVAILISLIFYLYNSFSISRMEFLNKIIVRDELGANPNATLNSISFLLIINQLLIVKNSRLITNFIQAVFIFICSMQFSRQNLIAGIFLMIHSFKKNKYLFSIFATIILILFFQIDFRIISYLVKGVSQLAGQTESTRSEWWISSISHIINHPYKPNFLNPVDNTFLTIILHTGLFLGIITLFFIFVSFMRIWSFSKPVMLSLATLFVLNDIIYEASFWFLVFSSLDNRIINQRILEV